jgi:N-(5-amino-5-carboxypentanoyl)-L-cysteinyl-D-valine synthase
MYPLPLDVAGRDLRHDVSRTTAIRRRVPHHGIGYGALFGRYGGPASPLPAVSFNYLGRLTSGQDGDQRAGWQLDPSMCGSHTGDRDTGADQFGLDVTMSCAEGRLVTEVNGRCGETTTRRFADELHASLARLVAEAPGWAPAEPDRERPGSDGADVMAGFDPYILVNEQEPGRALFVLPPGEGGAESYLSNLARHLPGHQLVLFNNVHLHSPMKSFEAIGEYYADHIRRLQPSGSYNLLGWSFGGVAALEVALQLTRAGERIDNLIFIDSYFNVRQASADIGLPYVPDILDPINYRYLPNPTDLARLHARTGRVVMFKADELNNVITGEHQRKLFDFYLRSSHHNLETLLPAESIELHTLHGETHHTWALNESLVATVCTRISDLLSAPAGAGVGPGIGPGIGTGIGQATHTTRTMRNSTQVD